MTGVVENRTFPEFIADHFQSSLDVAGAHSPLTTVGWYSRAVERRKSKKCSSASQVRKE